MHGISFLKDLHLLKGSTAEMTSGIHNGDADVRLEAELMRPQVRQAHPLHVVV